MKYIYVLLTLIFVNVLACSQKEDSQNAKQKLTSKSIEDIADDASWVYIIDDQITTAKQFDKEYKLFLSIVSTGSGASKGLVELKSESYELKEDVLQRIINNKLTYKKAIKTPFFEEEEGKNLVKAFFKTALNQYHIYKTLLPKIKEPSQKELIKFYGKYKELISRKGIKDIKDPRAKVIITKAYKDNKLQSILAKELGKFRLENNVKENGNIIKDYLAGRVKKETVGKAKDEDKYWILKVNQNTLSLKEALGIIDFQIKSMADNLDKGNKEKISQNILSAIKTMELSYIYLLDKGYHLTNEARSFIELVQIRSIALYYLMNEVISKVQIPSYQEASRILKNKDEKEKLIKTLGNAKYTNKELRNLLRQKIYKDKIKTAQDDFVDKIRDEHKIRISQKYFETKADKIQKEILGNN